MACLIDVSGQQIDRAGGVAQVPLQYPVDAGMFKGRQRAHGAARQRAQCRDPGRGEVAGAGQRTPREEGQYPREQRSAGGDLGDGDLGDGVDSGRGEVRRRPNALGCRDESRRRVLGLQLDPAEGRIGDLEHPDRRARLGPGCGGEKEVRVLLAAQRGHSDVHTEVPAGNVTRLLGSHRRNR